MYISETVKTAFFIENYILNTHIIIRATKRNGCLFFIKFKIFTKKTLLPYNEMQKHKLFPEDSQCR